MNSWEDSIFKIPSKSEESHDAASENCFSATNSKVVGERRQQKSETVAESILESFIKSC